MDALLRIEPRDGAAARAHFDDIEDRRFDGETAHVAANIVNRIYREAPVLDQGAFRRRAAHVERDDILKPKRLGVGARADAAADGTGFHETDGLTAGSLSGQQPAVGTHHEERTVETFLFEIAVQPANVSADLRSDVGVGRYRGAAFIFVPLVGEIRAEGDVDSGEKFLQRFSGGFFMDWVDVGVHEKYCHRLYLEFPQLLRKLFQRRDVERTNHFAFAAHALGHFEA